MKIIAMQWNNEKIIELLQKCNNGYCANALQNTNKKGLQSKGINIEDFWYFVSSQDEWIIRFHIKRSFSYSALNFESVHHCTEILMALKLSSFDMKSRFSIPPKKSAPDFFSDFFLWNRRENL